MELNMFISLYGWGTGNLGANSCFEIVVFRKVSVMKMFKRGKSCLTKAKFCDKLTKLEWKLDKLLHASYLKQGPDPLWIINNFTPYNTLYRQLDYIYICVMFYVHQLHFNINIRIVLHLELNILKQA